MPIKIKQNILALICWSAMFASTTLAGDNGKSADYDFVLVRDTSLANLHLRCDEFNWLTTDKLSVAIAASIFYLNASTCDLEKGSTCEEMSSFLAPYGDLQSDSDPEKCVVAARMDNQEILQIAKTIATLRVLVHPSSRGFRIRTLGY